MNSVQVYSPTGVTIIQSPSGKTMAFDPALLQHGVLSIGEYGANGVKIAAFKHWHEAIFLNGSEGYTIQRSLP